MVTNPRSLSGLTPVSLNAGRVLRVESIVSSQPSSKIEMQMPENQGVPQCSNSRSFSQAYYNESMNREALQARIRSAMLRPLLLTVSQDSSEDLA